jgi:cytochrome c5
MRMVFVLFLIIAFTACTVKLMVPAQSDVDRVSGKYPGYSVAELNADKALYESTCSRCHRLKNPRSRSEEKWDKIVPKMIARLNKKEGKEVIDARQQEAILRYLVTMGPSVKQ